MKSRLVDSLSILTTIPTKSLESLSEKAVWCICDTLESTIHDKDNITEIDLEIGKLFILVDGDSVKYKFIPSKELETGIKTTIVSKENTLVAKLESSLKSSILHTYKDIIQ